MCSLAGRTPTGVFQARLHVFGAPARGPRVAMTNLDIIERDGLVNQAKARGDYLGEQLRAAFNDHPLVAEVRGLRPCSPPSNSWRRRSRPSRSSRWAACRQRLL